MLPARLVMQKLKKKPNGSFQSSDMEKVSPSRIFILGVLDWQVIWGKKGK